MKNFLSTLKGKIIAGTVTLAVIAAAVAVGVSLNIGYRTICVDNFKGVTTVTANKTVSEVFKGQNLQSGSAVAVGENADLTLALDSDKHVYAKELTRFQLEALGKAGKDSRTVIKLEKGCVLSRIDGKLQENESYVVESPNALIAVRGTTFTVTVFYDEDGVCHTVVEVEEGTVEVTERDGNGNPTGEVRAVSAGESIEVTEDELSAENEPETTALTEETTVTTTVTTEETTAPVTTTTAAKEDFITIKGEMYSILLTELDLSEKELADEDIKPLEKMVNLKSLNLGYNQISDISALSGLTNLTTLYLDRNNISDISALKKLTNLTELYLYTNKISNISALSGLTNLETLWLMYNPISDISALSGLTNLKDLWLHNNQINDISALSGLTNLETLWLYDNQISDISALSGLTNLTQLRLENNQISDISALRKLTNLTSLDLRDNQISKEDIEDLKKALPNVVLLN